MKRTQKHIQAGYTLVEIVMSMAVMTIGATGLMALQRAAAVSNIESRQMTQASSVLQLWTERLRSDALLWNTGGNGLASADLSATTYITNIPAPGTIALWTTPLPVAGSGESYAFDYLGNDTLNDSGNTSPAVFCAQTRLQWFIPGQALRADVRVWWHRASRNHNAQLSDRRLFANCGLGSENVMNNDRRLRFISTSTIIRRNSLIQ